MNTDNPLRGLLDLATKHTRADTEAVVMALVGTMERDYKNNYPILRMALNSCLARAQARGN